MNSAEEHNSPHTLNNHSSLAKRAATLDDERQLWELMSEYNWDDGFEVPLAVLQNPYCDRALALCMYWELDDAAQIHHSDEENALREQYSTEATYAPEEFEQLVAYCTTLVHGLRTQRFRIGKNSFDTGFFACDNPALTDRERAVRERRTRVAQRDYEDGFIRPVTGV